MPQGCSSGLIRVLEYQYSFLFDKSFASTQGRELPAILFRKNDIDKLDGLEGDYAERHGLLDRRYKRPVGSVRKESEISFQDVLRFGASVYTNSLDD